MAEIDAAFVPEALDISEGIREPHIEHHRQGDDLGLVLKYSNGERMVMLGGYESPLPA